MDMVSLRFGFYHIPTLSNCKNMISCIFFTFLNNKHFSNSEKHSHSILDSYLLWIYNDQV